MENKWIIEDNKNSLRIWLNDNYSIRRNKSLKLWYLEYYRFGKDYMPDEIFADEDFLKVYEKYMEVR